jgi:hypothetical protein
MRIRLETTDRLPFWLIGDPTLNERTEGSASLNETVQITRNQQSVSGAEWEAKTFIDRGNQSVMVEVSTRREFATEWARWQFLESLAPTDLTDELHRWYGDIWLRFTNADLTFNECLLPDSIISLTGKQLQGEVGLTLNYRIQAAGFDVAAEQSGVEKVTLIADAVRSDVCGLMIYATTTGGAWDNADTVYAGTAPATMALGETMNIVIGDNNGVVTSRDFQVVVLGGTAAPGYLAIEQAAVDHLDAIADAFAGVTSVVAESGISGGRKYVYLGWTAAPIGADTEVIINFALGTSGYQAGSTAAAFNVSSSPDNFLVDQQGVSLIADRMT